MLEDLEPFLKFSIHLSVKISQKKLQTNIMENLKQASGEI